mgnify:CR=1 FL=1
MAVRGVRGATSVPSNDRRTILEATRTLLSTALKTNDILPDDIAAIMFAVTPDLDKAFPAAAAREMGLTNVPLLDFASPAVEEAMPRVIRMLLLWNTDRAQEQIRHVYLGDAEALRPDLVRV